MPSYRFTERERLALLAAAVLDFLDEAYTEAELELGGDQTEQLYNLAAAVDERDAQDGERDLDAALGSHVRQAWEAMQAQRTST